MFLALDTVFDQCSVAVVKQDLSAVSSLTQTGKREQTKQVLPMIDTALQQAGVKLSDINALIFNRGPGPFSGIRINTAVVQALAIAHDLPCVGVSSLAAIATVAHNQYGFDRVYAALDARMNQVYFAEYELSTTNKNVMVLAEGSKEQLVDYEDATEKLLPLVGNGAELLHILDGQQVVTNIQPEAVDIAKIGIAQFFEEGGVSAENALPVYLRNNAWKTLKEQGKA